MIVILGYEEQAKAITHYILNQTEEELLTIDLFGIDIDNKYKNRWKHLISSQNESLDEIFSSIEEKEKVIVINCLPTEYIIKATACAIKRGWNIIDLAGETEIERRQKLYEGEAITNGSTIIHGAGIAPGIVSSFVKEFTNNFSDDVIGINVYCGGVPKFPEYPLGYVRVFNESGVIKEYIGLADIIKDCRLVKVPALSERENIFIPSLGIMEADITTGGISTTLDNLDLEYFSYKTLRYPGHFNYVKNNILNQPKPVEVLKGLLEPVSETNPDVVVLHIEVETNTGWENCEWFWEYDYEENISAMAQATGYIAAEVALQTFEMKPGIYNMDVFDPYEIRKKVREIREDGNFSEEPVVFYRR